MLSRRTLLQGAAAGLAVASHASVFASEKQTPQTAGDTEKTPLNVFLFEGFETIDAMGPVEMLAYAGVYDIRFYGMIAGVVKSAQGVPVAVEAVEKADPEGLLLLPGAAPQWLKLPPEFFARVKTLAEQAPWVLTVCTGSVLLGRTGLLNGRRATDEQERRSDGPEDSSLRALAKERPLVRPRQVLHVFRAHGRDGHGARVPRRPFRR